MENVILNKERYYIFDAAVMFPPMFLHELDYPKIVLKILK